MSIWPWTWTNICSLSQHIFLNGYNFPEWICFHWTRIYFLERTVRFLEMNIISFQNITHCLEWLHFLWINICSMNESVFPWQLTSISFLWSWINTIHIKLCFVTFEGLGWKQDELSNLVLLSAGLGQRRFINKQNGGLGYLVFGCPLTALVLIKLGLLGFIILDN